MATGKKSDKKDDRFRDIAQNRRALHEYAITDRFEAGIVLQGSEVKGLRESGATISDAYVQIRNGEAWLIGAHFSDYENAGYAGHDPRRTRKLLLHRKEIERIGSALAERGLPGGDARKPARTARDVPSQAVIPNARITLVTPLPSTVMIAKANRM